MAIILNNIPEYVEQHKSGLIRNAVIGAKSAKLFNLFTGVKGATSLNLLNTSVSFGDGSACGWNAAGNSTISQRIITPGYPKVNMSFCDKTLLKTWMNYDVKVAAGQKTLPFEEDFINGVIENVQANLEKAIWQGDITLTGASEDVNLNKFDGLIKIAENASLAGTYEYASGATIVNIVNKLYSMIPSACFSKGEVVLYMGADCYRQYIQELIANGNLVITTNVNDVAMPDTVLIPGTNVRVQGVTGLDNTGKFFASYADNFVYGTDLQGDEEKFEMWYSQDNREFRLAVEFAAGVQIEFPDMLVEAKEAAE